MSWDDTGASSKSFLLLVDGASSLLTTHKQAVTLGTQELLPLTLAVEMLGAAAVTLAVVLTLTELLVAMIALATGMYFVQLHSHRPHSLTSKQLRRNWSLSSQLSYQPQLWSHWRMLQLRRGRPQQSRVPESQSRASVHRYLQWLWRRGTLNPQLSQGDMQALQPRRPQGNRLHFSSRR